jgi:hypothetical protein
VTPNARNLNTVIRNPFTVVELAVAMGILVIMMGLLVQFVNHAQTAWNQSRKNVRMYEGARLFYDIINRDLQGMITSDEIGAVINYTVDSSELPGNWIIAFVTSSGIGVKDTDTETIRHMATSSSGSWDFYNNPAGTWAATVAGASAVIIDGVRDITLTVQAPDGSSTISSASEDTVNTPSRIDISLQFFDPKMSALPVLKQNKSLREISTSIFIDRED